MPMSPTCTLLGIPPRAMTAQFSNSKGGMSLSLAMVHGRSRTMKLLVSWARCPGSLSRILQTSLRRLAVTRQAVGEMSIPIHWRPTFWSATRAVPQPQKASRTMSLG